MNKSPKKYTDEWQPLYHKHLERLQQNNPNVDIIPEAAGNWRDEQRKEQSQG